MKRCARVQHYRSIVDSGDVDVQETTTVLIGKQEQGKSNFLKALASYNQDYSYTPNDLPSHLRPSLEQRNPAEVPRKSNPRLIPRLLAALMTLLTKNSPRNITINAETI